MCARWHPRHRPRRRAAKREHAVRDRRRRRGACHGNAQSATRSAGARALWKGLGRRRTAAATRSEIRERSANRTRLTFALRSYWPRKPPAAGSAAAAAAKPGDGRGRQSGMAAAPARGRFPGFSRGAPSPLFPSFASPQRSAPACRRRRSAPPRCSGARHAQPTSSALGARARPRARARQPHDGPPFAAPRIRARAPRKAHAADPLSARFAQRPAMRNSHRRL